MRVFCGVLGSREVVCRPDVTVLKVVGSPSNGKQYPAEQSTTFQEDLTESLGATQNFYIGRIELEGKVAHY